MGISTTHRNFWTGNKFEGEKRMNIEKRIKEHEKRLVVIEDQISRMVIGDKNPDGMKSRRIAQGDIEKLKAIFEGPPTIAIDLTLPEGNVGGLYFNKQEVHCVFEIKEDGAYYSRDILFMSARNTADETGRDLLSEYLDSEAVRKVFRRALGDEVRVFLPKKNQGVKKYHNVYCWYWLADPYAGSAAYFCGVTNGGYAYGHYFASAVGGCAPAFRVD
jgi:hypothetical protein